MRDYERGTPVEPAVDYNRLTAVPEPFPELSTSRPLTKQQLLAEYEIRIRFLAKGCVVSVGCKELAFGTIQGAMEAIEKYIEDPQNVGDYWRGQFNMI
jgi:hypothetical protein